MLRRLPLPPEITQFWTIDEIDLAIGRLERRIRDIEALQANRVRHRAPHVRDVERRIRDTILEIFGIASQQFPAGQRGRSRPILVAGGRNRLIPHKSWNRQRAGEFCGMGQDAMKGSPRSTRAVGRSSRTPARPAYAVPRDRSRRLRLRRLALSCPGCDETYEFGADTPTQVFDPEIHRFACPSCLAVMRLLPYQDVRAEISAGQSDADMQAMAADLLTQPLCAGIGV